MRISPDGATVNWLRFLCGTVLPPPASPQPPSLLLGGSQGRPELSDIAHYYSLGPLCDEEELRRKLDWRKRHHARKIWWKVSREEIFLLIWLSRTIVQCIAVKIYFLTNIFASCWWLHYKEEIVHLEDEVHGAIFENSFIVLPER